MSYSHDDRREIGEGCGFLSVVIMEAIFIFLKVFGAVDCSWWWVFSPILAPVFLLALLPVVYFFVWFNTKWYKKPDAKSKRQKIDGYHSNQTDLNYRRDKQLGVYNKIEGSSIFFPIDKIPESGGPKDKM